MPTKDRVQESSHAMRACPQLAVHLARPPAACMFTLPPFFNLHACCSARGLLNHTNTKHTHEAPDKKVYYVPVVCHRATSSLIVVRRAPARPASIYVCKQWRGAGSYILSKLNITGDRLA